MGQGDFGLLHGRSGLAYHGCMKPLFSLKRYFRQKKANRQLGRMWANFSGLGQDDIPVVLGCMAEGISLRGNLHVWHAFWLFINESASVGQWENFLKIWPTDLRGPFLTAHLAQAKTEEVLDLWLNAGASFRDKPLSKCQTALRHLARVDTMKRFPCGNPSPWGPRCHGRQSGETLDSSSGQERG
jgi:hypothetical protein